MESSIADRFWTKVDKSGDCWLWISRATANFGYGAIRINRATLKAHRVAWELTNGPVPEGMCVLHRCDNPKCVKPAHLFLGTRRDNIHDCIAKGRFNAGSRLRAVTHCPKGHAYTPDNLYRAFSRNGNPRRCCRACGKTTALARYYRNKHNDMAISPA